jgi:hypothetical protein
MRVGTLCPAGRELALATVLAALMAMPLTACRATPTPTPVPTPTPTSTSEASATPAATATPTAEPTAESFPLLVLHTNDNWGETLECG